MKATAGRAGRPRQVEMRQIKEWAATRLGPDSTLRKVIEREGEVVQAEEFVGKVGVWLQLLEIEEDRR